jgi:hypothetical protein
MTGLSIMAIQELASKPMSALVKYPGEVARLCFTNDPAPAGRR